jgi:signal transduction histidine kinase
MSLISAIFLFLIFILFNYQKTEFITEKKFQPLPKAAPIRFEETQIKPKVSDEKQLKEFYKAQKDLEEVKSQLEKVTAQKDMLTSLISHDLRTPLNSIFGFCQLLKDGEYKGKKEVKRFAENIYELSKIQLNALNKILDWTRYEAEDAPFNPTEFDITSTINFIAKSFTKIAEAKKISIKVNSESNLIVFGDEFMIIEVLKNLLENAIKYSREISTVEIITHYHPKINKLVVLVCDSGIGIKKDLLLNLLSTSSKITIRGTKGEKGIGLGLLICKAIIDKHGEHLWIASEEGEWTRVYFTLKPSKQHS